MCVTKRFIDLQKDALDIHVALLPLVLAQVRAPTCQHTITSVYTDLCVPPADIGEIFNFSFSFLSFAYFFDWCCKPYVADVMVRRK